MKKIWCLPLLISNIAVLASTDNIGYVYQYDNAGFVNHQVTTKLSINQYSIAYTHNDTTTTKTNFFYDKVLAYTAGNISNLTYSGGVGALYGTDWNMTVMYDVSANYNGFNVNAVRSTKATPGLTPNSYSRTYSDDINASYEFKLLSDLSVIIGGKQTFFQNSASSTAIIGKLIYDVNDNWSIMYHSQNSYSNIDSIEFFNRKQYSYNRFLIRYSDTFLNDKLSLNINAGPSLVEINNHSQLVPYHEEKMVYDVDDDLKLEVNNMCTYSINAYHYCQIGGNINIAF